MPQIRVAIPGSKDNWAGTTTLYTTNMDGGTTDGTYKTFTHTFTLTQFMVENGVQVRPGEFVGGITYVSRHKEAMLHEGSEVIPFKRAGRNYPEELQLCQRYYEKSYALETAPGTPTVVGREYVRLSGSYSTAGLHRTSFITPKRAATIGFIYSSITGAQGYLRDETASIDKLADPQNSTEFGFQTSFLGGLGGGGGASLDLAFLSWQWTADAEL